MPLKQHTTKLKIIASWLWISYVLYLPIQIAVASAWNTPYDWRHNYISDLGNTTCGTFSDLYVCSPLHPLMNSAFITLGLFTFIGGVLFAISYRTHKAALVGFSMLALGGIGSMIVGLVPENTNLDLHSLGALMPFLLGNIGVLVIGLSHFITSKPLRIYTIASGLVAIGAFLLFIMGIYPLLGVGGMERLTDYTQMLWLIVFGIYTLRHIHTRKNA